MASIPKYSTSGMQPELLNFEDAAGENLYIKITQSHHNLSQSIVEQITGMLLNCDSKTEILRMLQDDEFLHGRVETARKILLEIHNSSEICGTTHCDLDDDLFEAVENLQPDYAPQITGMLLELSPSTKRRIVTHPTELQEAVDRAMTMLVPQGEGGDNDMGEIIYEMVETMYPQLAEKITGMLLELSTEELTELIKNRSRLQQKAKLAYQTLQEASLTA